MLLLLGAALLGIVAVFWRGEAGEVKKVAKAADEATRGEVAVLERVVKGDGSGQIVELVRDEAFKYPLRRVERAGEAVREMVGDHVMVTVKEGADLDAALRRLGGTLRRRVAGTRMVLVSFPATGVNALSEFMARARLETEVFERVEPDFILHACALPNDPSFSSLWGLHNTGANGGSHDADIDAPEAWELSTGGSSVVVGVLDSGVDHTHPDLVANMWTNAAEIAGNGLDDDANGFIDDTRGWDFYSDDADPADDNSHGTHCAGTIAAAGNNGAGITGVCWTARIMALRFLGTSGSGVTSDAVAALAYAKAMGAHLTSNSYGSGGESYSLRDAIAAGPLFIAAAGNSGANTDTSPFYPAAYDLENVLSIAAIDRKDALADFSNFGRQTVHLAAPGVEVLSCVPGGGYGLKSGTSMAVPHVSGVCALLKAWRPALTSEQIRHLVLRSAVGTTALAEKTITGGRVNARGAMDALRGMLITPEAGFATSGPVAGPFTGTRSFTLFNAESTAVTWSVASSQPWVTLSSTGGTLAAGESVVVTAGLGSAALALPTGEHTALLSFSDGSTRPVTLTIEPVLEMIFVDGFESGGFGPAWTISGTPGHRTTVEGDDLGLDDYEPRRGVKQMVMGSYLGPANFVRNEATLTLDLAGRRNVHLEFWVKTVREQPHGPPDEPFTTGADFDGVAVSADGITWREVRPLRTRHSLWTRYLVPLDTAGMAYTSAYKIRFNRYDRGMAVSQNFKGILIDEVRVAQQIDRRLFINAASAAEEGTVVNATLEVELPPAEGMTIQLSIADPILASVPASVALPAGASSVSFPITLPEDALLDGSSSTLITASALSYLTATHALRVDDDETAVLTMTLPTMLTEGDAAAHGTVKVSTPVEAPVTVGLMSSDASELRVPASVTIPAGQSSAAFSLTVMDETLIDGPQPVTITASVPNWTSGSAASTVQDNESTQIVLELPATAREGQQGVKGRVRLGGVFSAAVSVSLVSSDVSEITVPTSVLIPAGMSEVEFALSIVDDVEADGAQSTAITASAAGLMSGTASMSVRDDDAHHFTFAPLAVTQVRNAPFAVTITARDAANAVMVDFDLTLSLSANAPISKESVSGFDEGIWTGMLAVTEYQNGVVLTVTDAGGHSGSSNAFDVILGPLHHFSWDIPEDAKTQDTPFAVTLTAKDAGGNTVTGFTGTADLHAMSRPPERQVVSGYIPGYSNTITTVTPDPNPPWRWSMSQAVTGKRMTQLLRPEQIGGSGVIERLVLDYTTVSMPMGAATVIFDEFTIRMKHSSLTSLEGQPWDDGGWTEVSSGPAFLFSHSRSSLLLFSPFVYNGSDSLLIDIQAKNRLSSDAPQAILFSTSPTSFVSSQWGTTSDAASYASQMISMSLGMRPLPAKVFPLTTGAFTAGVWQGMVTIPFINYDGVYLRAKNGAAEGWSDHLNMISPEWSPISTPPANALALTMTGEAVEDGTSTLTISLPGAAGDVPVTVNLAVMPVGRSSLPASVVIPAGQTSVSVTADWTDNTLLEGQVTLRLTATAAGFSPGELDVKVRDDELLPPVVTPLPATMAENTNTPAFVMATFAQPASRVMHIPLTSSPAYTLQHDSTLTLNPGEHQARLVVYPVNDRIIDLPSDKPVTLTLGYAGSPLAVLNTVVTDDEARTLSFGTLNETTEGQLPVPVTQLSVSGSLSQALEVTLTSSDPAQLSVPASVMVQNPVYSGPGGGGIIIGGPIIITNPRSITITTSDFITLPWTGFPILLPGFPSFGLNAMANVPLTAVDNALMDGSRVVTLTASAVGFTPASMQVTVRDNELHHLNLSVLEPGAKQVAVPFAIDVSARDVEGRVIAGHAGAVTLTPSAGTMSPALVTMQNGFWRGGVAFLNAGPAMRFTATQGSASVMSDPFEVLGSVLDDADGNGQGSLAELAFGKGRRPTLVRGTDPESGLPCFLFTHRRLRGAHGLSYHLELSDDLITWRPAGADAVEVPTSSIELVSSATEPVTWRVRAVKPQVFVRMRVGE